MKKYKNVLILLISYIVIVFLFRWIPVSNNQLVLSYAKKIIFSFLLIVITVYFLQKDQIMVSSLKIVTPYWGRDILIGIAACIIIVPVVFGSTWLSMIISRSLYAGTVSRPVSSPVSTSALRTALYAFYSITVTPFVQEMFFRGGIFYPLRLKMGLWPALLISSAVFACFHFSLLWLVPFFVLGLFLGYVFYQTGSLLTAIAAHAIYNAVALFMYFRF